MKGYSVLPKTPAFLELHHQIVKCHIQETRWRSRCILQPQSSARTPDRDRSKYCPSTPPYFLWLNFISHHHDHVVPLPRISLTLSRHFSLSFIASGRSSELHPVSSHRMFELVVLILPGYKWGSIRTRILNRRISVCFSLLAY